MTEGTQNKKSSTMKTLAIASFVVLIIIIAWLSVQLVNVVPGAFSSLATVAESIKDESSYVNENQELDSLIVTSNTTLINSGDEIVLSWSTHNMSGSYLFSYECTEGASLSIIDADGVKAIDCNSNYNLGDESSLILQVESEKSRYENINYSVSFMATKDDEPRASGNASFTVINSQIQDLLVVDQTEEVEENEEVETEAPSTPTTPVYEQEFVYEIPTSNPNGRTDLSVRFLNVGQIIGNSFVPGTIYQDDQGAIQFEVKNLGSKTSQEWMFQVSLPTGGYYESEEQEPLKPNEQATITIGFNTSSDDDHTFKVSIEEETDVNSINDRFIQPISILD